MYRKIKPAETTLKVNQSYEGETIEDKVKRILNNKEPITDNAPITYTDRKDGVQPQYDIRADKFEIQLEMADKVAELARAERTARIIKMEEGDKGKVEKGGDIGGPEPTQGTDGGKK